MRRVAFAVAAVLAAVTGVVATLSIAPFLFRQTTRNSAPPITVQPVPRFSTPDFSPPAPGPQVQPGVVTARPPTKLAPLEEARTAMVAFTNSAFPYAGLVPWKQSPFLDVTAEGRRGHSSGRLGGVYWEDKTYSDRSVLLSFPKHFDIRRPAVLVVFFHGNGATLGRDVVQRQRVAEQVAASGLNAILVAPQFASDALDSSAGNFWTPGFFARFLKEAASRLASLYGAGASPSVFESMPVILVAYSGGYDPAAYSLAIGGTTPRRVIGLILLDALYGENEKFVDWIEKNVNSAFFVSAYSQSSARGNSVAQASLTDRRIGFRESLPSQLRPGTIAFLSAGGDVDHGDFVTKAWVPLPLQSLLGKVPDYRAPAPSR